ncbi:uncharacterized protein LOC134342181 isoform X2 [Mobula hypostoma]|uniref:uncharacterized protein LOC134342181 isoform X2 n=1 Tax=Mobula hypostoma TaxID=723540 RepID=UPI002FC33C59
MGVNGRLLGVVALSPVPVPGWTVRRRERAAAAERQRERERAERDWELKSDTAGPWYQAAASDCPRAGPGPRRTPRSKPRRPPGPRSLCPRLCQHPPAEGDQPGADGQLGPTPPQGPDAGQRQTPGPLDPSHVALLALALCVLGSASTLPRREISREQTVTSARLLRKALTQVNAKLLSHLGLEGSHQPSICLPPVERSSAGWYRYPGTTVSCREPLDPGPAFWTSEVEGGVNVIRDLFSDLELLVGQSDSLVSDDPA